MRRRALLVATIAASLAAAPAAAAKGVQRVQLCGATECVTFDRGNAGNTLAQFAEVGPRANPPGRATAWYQLRTRIGGRDVKPAVFTSAYVPSLGLVRVDDMGGGGYQWYVAGAAIAPILRTTVNRLTPRPAASLRVHDVAPGVPGPVATASAPRRESGVGGGWWVLAAAAGAALAAGLLMVRRR